MANVISLVTYKILPARTGGQRSIALFNTYLSRFVRLICVTTRNNDASTAQGYEVMNILPDGPSRYISPFFYFRLRRIIREQQVTHLMLEHPYFGWMAVLTKWFCGVTLIVRSQNIEGLRWKTLGKWWWKLLWHYERWVHRQADHNFFIQADDLQYAVSNFQLKRAQCTLVTYGIEANDIPAPAAKKAAKVWLQQNHQIPADHTILLFNGTFSYKPNLQALDRIIHTLLPALQAQKEMPCTIIVCGKDIPAAYSQQSLPGIVFAGFVEQIDTYFMGADVFLNPVNEGGGIKTKLVEALSYNTNAVSTLSGAIGVDPALCNGKLRLTRDTLEDFVPEVKRAARYQADLPPAFFRHFYWGDIARQAAAVINK